LGSKGVSGVGDIRRGLAAGIRIAEGGLYLRNLTAL
jgi:hypothetical protein